MNHLFTKEKIHNLIKECRNVIDVFIHSEATINIRYKPMEKFVHILMSYECIFGYLYAEEYNYGNVTDVINPNDDEYTRYTLASSLVFPNRKQKEELFSKLSLSLEYVNGFVSTSGILKDEESSQMLTNNLEEISSAINLLSEHKNIFF